MSASDLRGGELSGGPSDWPLCSAEGEDALGFSFLPNARDLASLALWFSERAAASRSVPSAVVWVFQTGNAHRMLMGSQLQLQRPLLR
jgi:hypothetical protein